MVLPAYDNHLHLSPSGRNIEALREFRAAGGTGLTLVTLPYQEVIISEGDDFLRSFNITLSLAEKAKMMTDLKINVSIGPYPVLLIPLAERFGLEKAEKIMIEGMEHAASLVAERLKYSDLVVRLQRVVDLELRVRYEAVQIAVAFAYEICIVNEKRSTIFFREIEQSCVVHKNFIIPLVVKFRNGGGASRSISGLAPAPVRSSTGVHSHTVLVAKPDLAARCIRRSLINVLCSGEISNAPSMLREI